LYLKHYSTSSCKTSTSQDLTTFLLVEYAAKTWCYHAALQENSDDAEEISLLTSLARKRDWLLIQNLHRIWERPLGRPLGDVGSRLYYASLIGLELTVGDLIRARAKVNAEGGDYSNALQAASREGHEKVVQMLIDAGADVKAKGR